MSKLSRIILFAALLGQPAFAQDVRPGDTPPSAATAQAMFDQGCIANLPDFAQTEQLLENSGVFKRAETGTYFHQVFNLSFKVHINDGQLACSMVFINRGDVARVTAELNEIIANIRTQHGGQFPNASFELLLGEDDNAGFYRLAIFMNPN